MNYYNYNKNRLQYIGCLVILIFLLGGCSDESISSDKKDKKEVLLEFKMKTSNMTPPKVITKSGQTSSESLINEVEIFVFENDKYQYKAEGASINNSGANSTTFKARIKSSTQPTTLYIIANADADIALHEPTVGQTTAEVKAELIKSISSTGIGGNLPMWGSYDLPTGISAAQENNITPVNMLRSMARVDIINVSAIPFALATIQAFNIADNLQLIPNNATSTPSVTTPSVPSGTTYTIQTDPISTTSADNSTAQIYLPEAVAPILDSEMISASCIVIGGYYNGSSTLSYYRLDIDPGINGHPLGQILRNFRYEFNLTRITKAGYATALEAANSAPTGASVTIVLWQDYIQNIVFNSSAYFGISSNYVVLPGKQNSTVQLLTETDVPGYTIRWANAQGTPVDLPSTTITNDYFQVDKSADGSTLDITTLQLNPIGSATRNIRYVLIEANDLKLLVTLLQEPDEFNPGNVTWAVANVDQPGTFAARIQDTGMIYQWNRRKAWAATGNVTGWDSQGASGNVWEDVTDPCPPGWRVPASKELNALLNDSPGRIWRSTYAGYEISGVWFAPSQPEAEAATFANPGNAIFMPAAGGRHIGGNLYNQESNGYYWADNLDQGGIPYVLSLVDGTSAILPSEGRAAGCTIRCVKANN